jgi:5-methylcytosine-specific restriction endonuclease McrA
MDSYYYEYFWSWAAAKAVRDHRYCEDCCGTRREFEVHHIEPLNGEYRTWNVKNRHDNLVVLCHDCHVLRHKAPPKPVELSRVPLFEFAGVEIGTPAEALREGK